MRLSSVKIGKLISTEENNIIKNQESKWHTKHF